MKFLNRLKTISIFILLIFSLGIFQVQPALAHRPHDVIEQVELSPNYNQDQTVFIIARLNLFKSTDGGSRWQRIVKGLDNRTDLSSLAISAKTKKTLFMSTLGDGIYKSEDEGASWFKVNQGLDNLKIDLIAISAESDDVVLAAGQEKGLYKTKDGGKTWSTVLDGNTKITALAFAPTNKDPIIAGDNKGNLYISNDVGEAWKKAFTIQDRSAITALATSPNFAADGSFFVGTDQGSIFKTVDKGNSFTPVNKGLSGGSIRDIVISSDYGKTSSLYASTWHDGFFQSNDGGQSWQKSSQGLTKDHQADQDQFKSPHFMDLRISSNFSQDKTAFLGGFNGLFKSSDSGQSWQEINTLSTGTIISLDISPNYQNDSTLAFATYVGEAYISKDQGATWQVIMKGLEIPRIQGDDDEPNQDPRRFFDIAFSPNYASDNSIFATLLWTKFLRSTNQGNSWNILSLSKEVRGVTIATSPNFTADKTIYLGSQAGITFKSTDAGKTFSVIATLGKRANNEPPAIVVSPDFAADKTLYASGKEGVYKSVDAGQTWQPINNGLNLLINSRIQLAISPNYKLDQTVILGTEMGIFKTQDGGKSWVKLAGSAYGGDGYIEGFAISPNYQNDQTFIASVRGKGLFKTVNGGQSFTLIGDQSLPLAKMTSVPSAGIPIQFSPAYAKDQTIYGFGSANTEVFKSTDGGNTWTTLAVQRQDTSKYDLLTSVQLQLYIYRRRILSILVALIMAVASYFLVGYLGLEKKLPLSKVQIKAFSSFLVFLVVLLVLFKLV